MALGGITPKQKLAFLTNSTSDPTKNVGITVLLAPLRLARMVLAGMMPGEHQLANGVSQE